MTNQTQALTTTQNGARGLAGGMDLMTLGEMLARSKYFSDSPDKSQAIVKVLYGMEVGVSPVAAMMGIHVIKGKPSLGAGLIASIIRASRRYDYRIRDHTDQLCDIEFFMEGESLGRSSFTMDDARKAEVSSANGAAWKHFPRNMLFARAMSNGARWYCPDIFGGAVYTPEELGATVDGDGEIVTSSARVVDEDQPPAAEAETSPHPAAQPTSEVHDGQSVWLVGGVRCFTVKRANGGRFLVSIESCPVHGNPWYLSPDRAADAWAHGSNGSTCHRAAVLTMQEAEAVVEESEQSKLPVEEPHADPAARPAPKVSRTVLAQIYEQGSLSFDYDKDQTDRHCQGIYGVVPEELTTDQARELLTALRQGTR